MVQMCWNRCGVCLDFCVHTSTVGPWIQTEVDCCFLSPWWGGLCCWEASDQWGVQALRVSTDWAGSHHRFSLQEHNFHLSGYLDCVSTVEAILWGLCMSELISSSCYESVIHTQQHRRSRFLVVNHLTCWLMRVCIIFYLWRSYMDSSASEHWKLFAVF